MVDEKDMYLYREPGFYENGAKNQDEQQPQAHHHFTVTELIAGTFPKANVHGGQDVGSDPCLCS